MAFGFHLWPAYIDPGTMQSIFPGLAPLLAAAAGLLGFVLFPLRWLLAAVWRRYKAMGAGLRRGIVVAGPLAVAGAAFGVWWAGERSAPPAVRANRVIVVGMDGLDPGILEPMMDRGELPNFDRLRRQGGYSRLATSTPPESPVAWSCAATGCNPGRHGVFDFMHRSTDTYLPQLSLYKPNPRNLAGLRKTMYVPVRQAKGFWTHASEAGVATTVVRWPEAFPPEEVTGNFLSGLGVPDVAGAMAGYQFFSTRPAEFDNSGRVTPVQWDGDRIVTDLLGPPRAGSRERSKLALIVERSSGRPTEAVRITIGDQPPIELAEGQWSEWIRVRFDLGPMQSCGAILKFHLSEVIPHFRLYAGPPEVDPTDPAFPITHPEEYAPELAQRIGLFHTLGICEKTQAVTAGLIPADAFLAEVEQIDREREAMLDLELSRYRGGLLAFVLDSSDRIQHLFWSTRDSEHPAYNAHFAAAYGHVIPDMYRRMDRVLGKVLGHVTDDTVLLVMSDHGFTSFRRWVNVNRWLVDNGYMVLTEGRQEGRDLLLDVDWSRTKAYCLGFTGVYVNLKGREAKGIVEPGRPYRELCQELASKLAVMQDTQTGKQAVSRVFPTEEIYRGPQAGSGPDLVIGFQAGYRSSWSTVLGGSPKDVFGDVSSNQGILVWSGDHIVDPQFVPGILLSNRPIKADHPRLIDVAPTILKCLGITRPEEMDGTPLL